MIRPIFKKIDKDFQLLLSTLPMSVYVTKNPDDETESQLIKTRDRFLKLPEDIKDKLASLETSRHIQDIGKEFQLNLFQMASIARLVRNYYFGEIKMENFASVLSEEMEIDLAKTQEIAKQITEKIINKNMQSESNIATGDKTIIKLPILEALKKYPDLGRQRISANDIKLKIFPDPVTPSIKNWIADYRQFMGTRDYEAVEKSRYLFQSENTKKLNSQELQKLSLVLKSLDDHTPLTINAQDQQIIFPPFKVKEEMPKIAYSARGDNRIGVAKTAPEGWKAEQQNKNDAGSFRFSSPQTFESEREKKEKLNENKSKDSRYYQIYPMGIKTDSEENKARAKKNVVNLKENF